MARPKGMGGSAPTRKIPAAPPPAHQPDMLERHISMTNRQNLPFESPAASFMRAKTNILARHDQARKEQQQAGTKVSKADLMNWQAEAADHAAIEHYKHHFTHMRGTATVRRENIVVKKT